MSVYKRDTAIQNFFFTLINASDGQAITSGAVSGFITADGAVSQSALTNPALHKGNGQWGVTITAAETAGENIGLLFTHALAINVHFTFRTSVNDVDDVFTEADKATDDLAIITGVDGVILAGTQPWLDPNQTLPLTEAQFNLRSLPSADYLVATDTLARVTLVDTTTTNTDMKGTDNVPTAAAPTAIAIRQEMDASSTQFLAILANIAALNDFNPALDPVANVTLVATTTTNTDMKGTDGANTQIPLTSGQVTSACDDAPKIGQILTNIGALFNISTGDVRTQVMDVMDSQTFMELGLGAVPNQTTTITNMLRMLYALATNHLEQTATTQTLKTRLNTGAIGTAGVSDDGTTAIRASYT